MKYDFCGWATKNGLKCADGRTIRKNAFAANDGKTVPIVYMHNHGDISAVLGHALLENRDEGVYAYCKLNNTKGGKDAKEAVNNGDLTALSINANQLVHDGYDVVNGNILEVSLVLAGANPGAFIESTISHGMGIDDGDQEAIIYTNEEIEMYHADDPEPEPAPKGKSEEVKTPAQILDSMTEDQKQLVGALLAQAAKGDADDPEPEPENDNPDDNNKGGSEMKHSAFQKDANTKKVITLTHDDVVQILNDGKRLGSLKEAILQHMQDENSALYHALDTTGMETAKGTNTYGVRDPEMLIPDAQYQGPPEFISRNMDWVNVVLGKTSKSPFMRIKSMFADITEDEARAKGYIKGKQKKDEVFALLKRVTDPQTIYKRQKMDRDDIIDIDDNFDVFAWIRSEMEVMLNEEKARAILIGDGRLADDNDKIKEDRIRPIATDVALFNTIVQVTGSTGSELAKNFLYQAIKARKNYKGSGSPDLFTTEDLLTDMLLLENKNGDRLYKSEAELATALRVKEIHTVEPMEGTTVKGSQLLGIIVNLIDYKVGTNNKGKRSMFDDFDLNFNQQIYLLEERFSGALTKPFSALTFVKAGTSPAALTEEA